MAKEIHNQLWQAINAVPVPLVGKEGNKKPNPYRFENAEIAKKQVKNFISKVLNNKINDNTAVAFMDITIFNSGKKGVLLTEDAVYNTAGSYVLYKDIADFQPKSNRSSILVIKDRSGKNYDVETATVSSVEYTVNVLEAVLSVFYQWESEETPVTIPAPQPEKTVEPVKPLQPKETPEPTPEQKYNEGIDAYFAQNYEKAINLLLPLAQEGNKRAQYFCGCMYFWGRGVESDHEKAFYYTQQSAQQDDYFACMFLGSLYGGGKGTERDLEKAVYWLEKSIDLGNTSDDAKELLALIKADLQAEQEKAQSENTHITEEIHSPDGRDVEKSMKMLEEWIKNNPDDYSIRDFVDESIIPELISGGFRKTVEYTLVLNGEIMTFTNTNATWRDLFLLINALLVEYGGGAVRHRYLYMEELFTEDYSPVDDYPEAITSFLMYLDDILCDNSGILPFCDFDTEVFFKGFVDFIAQLCLPAEEAFVDGYEIACELEGYDVRYFSTLGEARKFLDPNLYFAQEGDAEYQYEVGREYYLGEERNCDYNEALYWLEKAYANEVYDAADIISLIYIKKDHELFDIEKALHWALKAQEHNTANGDALVDAIQQMKSENSVLIQAEKAYNSGDYLTAYEYYDKIANSNSEALYRRGLMLLKGIGVDCNEKYGYYDLLKASENGNINADKSIEEYRNMLEEAKYFRKEAKNTTLDNLARKYENTQNKHIASHIGMEYGEKYANYKNERQNAIKWLEKAGKLGDSNAWYALAQIYLLDNNEKNSATYLNYLENALHCGAGSIAPEMAEIYLDKRSGFYDVKKAVDILERGGILLDTNSLYESGKVYLEHYKELGIDREEARLIANMQFGRAARSGHVKAQEMLKR